MGDANTFNFGPPQPKSNGLLWKMKSKQLLEVGKDAIWTVSSCKRGLGKVKLI